MGSRIEELWSPYAMPPVLNEGDRESPLGLIPGAEGICGRHIGQAVVVTGPCGIKHTMSLSAGRALAAWLNQHCQPVRDAEFITLEEDQDS